MCINLEEEREIEEMLEQFKFDSFMKWIHLTSYLQQQERNGITELTIRILGQRKFRIHTKYMQSDIMEY